MLLIKNGLVVDPKSGLDTQADVLVDGKKVVKIAENIEAGDAQVIDATGLVVAPGLVDIHVHFRNIKVMLESAFYSVLENKFCPFRSESFKDFNSESFFLT